MFMTTMRVRVCVYGPFLSLSLPPLSALFSLSEGYRYKVKRKNSQVIELT
jgi:hypothetical protein